VPRRWPASRTVNSAGVRSPPGDRRGGSTDRRCQGRRADWAAHLLLLVAIRGRLWQDLDWRERGGRSRMTPPAVRLCETGCCARMGPPPRRSEPATPGPHTASARWSMYRLGARRARSRRCHPAARARARTAHPTCGVHLELQRGHPPGQRQCRDHVRARRLAGRAAPAATHTASRCASDD